MRRVVTATTGVLGTVLLNGALALANEPKGGPPDYSGISFMYYFFIFVVLAYGVYDTFFKKT